MVRKRRHPSPDPRRTCIPSPVPDRFAVFSNRRVETMPIKHPGGRFAPAGLSVLSLAALLALGTAAPSTMALSLPGAPKVTAARVTPDPRIVDLGLAAATDVKTIT